MGRFAPAGLSTPASSITGLGFNVFQVVAQGFLGRQKEADRGRQDVGRRRPGRPHACSIVQWFTAPAGLFAPGSPALVVFTQPRLLVPSQLLRHPPHSMVNIFAWAVPCVPALGKSGGKLGGRTSGLGIQLAGLGLPLLERHPGIGFLCP